MGFDELLNTGAVPQDERMADFIARSRADRNFCYEAAERAARRVAEDPEVFRQYLDVQSRFLRYTANNALLILEQKPEARRLGDMAYWKEKGAFVKRSERAKPVLVMEPGKEYRREDDTYGQYYNAKKLYDVSQTTIPKREWQGAPREYEDAGLIRALISRAPVPSIRRKKNCQKGRGPGSARRNIPSMQGKAWGRTRSSAGYPENWHMRSMQKAIRDMTGRLNGSMQNVPLISYAEDMGLKRKGIIRLTAWESF